MLYICVARNLAIDTISKLVVNGVLLVKIILTFKRSYGFIYSHQSISSPNIAFNLNNKSISYDYHRREASQIPNKMHAINYGANCCKQREQEIDAVLPLIGIH